MNHLISEIINFGVCAPSGENSQPWRFLVRGNSVYIYNIPDRDNKVYNFRQRGSYLAHGACIENMCIAARASGYTMSIELFPNTESDLVAVLTLDESTLVKELLVSVIKKRVTNRKIYKNVFLPEVTRKSLLQVNDSLSGVEVHFIEEIEKRKKIASALSINDKILLENKILHNIIFDNICWNLNQEKRLKKGLYIKTMELKPHQELIFRLLKHWWINSLLGKVGLPKFIAEENSKIYSSGSAFVILSVNNNDHDFVAAGRVTQRLWLQATALGLSVQPIAALPYIAERVNSQNEDIFTPKQKEEIQLAYTKIRSICEVPQHKTIAMTLRIGFGESPSATSSRLLPDIKFDTI